jgi:glycosyltransferase involved in cell wall biosynthesis
MKILFVVPSAFPTQKAYGVTTRESMVAAKNLGHQVYSLSLKSNYTDSDYDEITDSLNYLKVNKTINGLKNISFRSINYLSKAAWIIMQDLLIKFNYQAIYEIETDLIWCRGERTAKTLRKLFPTTNMVVEIHANPKNRILNKLAKVSRKNSLLLAPINQNLMDLLKVNYDFKKCIAGMSISSGLLANEEAVFEFVGSIHHRAEEENFKIGYVGKFFPGGFSKGYEDLIDLAVFYKINLIERKISVAGGLENEVREVEKKLTSLNLNSNNIEITGHLKHSESLAKVKSLDVIVLPEPRDPNYLGSPLKSYEACALGRILVVADCRINREQFGDAEFVYWYQSKNVESLAHVINFALKDESLCGKLLKQIDFASGYTWDVRVKNVLEAIAG